jgi:hypothetical protein
MPFKPNNTFGSTSKRGKAKINKELKNYLENAYISSVRANRYK